MLRCFYPLSSSMYRPSRKPCKLPYSSWNGETLTGKLDPGEWMLSAVIISVIGYALFYASLNYIVLASLQRYYRLCAVKKGTTHEKLFKICKHVVGVATICAFLSNSINVFIYRHAGLTLVQIASQSWLLGLDFYVNFSVRLFPQY
jgi:hypothetical protein